MLNEKSLHEFVEPYYADKDIMHNMWHIELVKKMVNKILSIGSYEVEEECLMLVTYFHGFIYKDEEKSGSGCERIATLRKLFLKQ